MTQRFHPQISLRCADGRRKYLTPDERERFIAAALDWRERSVGLLCLMLAYSGCRISEALAMTALSIDAGEGCVAIRSLKKRGHVVIRTVPLPRKLIEELLALNRQPEASLWPISRSTAWMRVKTVMASVGVVGGPHATPKGLRHGFGIHATRCGIPLNLVQRWLGHARISTTAIYADAVGAEERELAERMWEAEASSGCIDKGDQHSSSEQT
ncbi:MAG: tyrosine-type recombinase/integrase [Hyphomicrobiaceae bacterium]|nr:tyrosine-type recombinase/integrase [Hyphomicrobiaceae bacterium]